MNEKKLPLEGINVVELGTHVAVPNVGRFLADFGANVIKVESTKGDQWRIVGRNNRCPIDEDENPFFTLQNANKKFISLDLKAEEGMEIMHKLLAKADVFVTNNRMAALKKMELDYESVKDQYPSLVYAHFSGYGYEGPDAEKPGFDSVAFWARSGAMIDWGAVGGFPFVAPTAAGDGISASNLCCGVLTALIARERTGKGDFVSTSLLNNAIWLCGSCVLSTQFGNEFPKDAMTPSNPFGFPYRCRDDEWLMVGVVDYTAVYPKICRVLGMDDIAEDPRFSTIVAVRQNISEFMTRINAAFLTNDRDYWVEEISKLGVICGKIGHMKDLHNDPQAVINGFVKPVTYPNGESVDMPTVPVKFGSYDTAERYECSGALGRDTAEILGKLGYSPEQIAAAKESGAAK